MATIRIRTTHHDGLVTLHNIRGAYGEDLSIPAVVSNILRQRILDKYLIWDVGTWDNFLWT